VRYENPQRRRLNAMAATVTCGPETALTWMLAPRHFDAIDLVHFLYELPAPDVPTVVVLDNAGFHRGSDIRAHRPDLRARRIYLYYLPPYSPELNDIERLFRTIKHCELPERVYPTIEGLEAAVDIAFAHREQQFVTKHSIQPRRAA
jgi:putative transposase